MHDHDDKAQQSWCVRMLTQHNTCSLVLAWCDKPNVMCPKKFACNKDMQFIMNLFNLFFNLILFHVVDIEATTPRSK